MSHTRMKTIAFILPELFPLDGSDAVLCLLCNLNNLWYIIMILSSYVEHVMRMCRHGNDNSCLHTF